MRRLTLITVLALLTALPLTAEDVPTLAPDAWQVLPTVEAPHRIFERYLLSRDAPAPENGTGVPHATEATWTTARPDRRGYVAAGPTAWAYGVVEAPRSGVWLAEIERAGVIFVNGDPIHGDAHGLGAVRHPVHLRAGTNAIYVTDAPGPFRVAFRAPDAEAFMADLEVVRTDDPAGRETVVRITVRIVSASLFTIRPIHLEATLVVGTTAHTNGTRLPSLAPLSETRVALALPVPDGALGLAEARIDLQLADCDAVLHERSVRVPPVSAKAAEGNPGRADPSPTPYALPFARVPGRDVVLVAGTSGTREEDHELLAFARYDAQRWLGRRDRLAEVVRDVDVLRDGRRHDGRHVVLYGNADTNAAWKQVFPPTMPLLAERGRIRMDDVVHEGSDLAGYVVYPRRHARGTLASAVLDTGPRGTRASFLLRRTATALRGTDYVVFAPNANPRSAQRDLTSGSFTPGGDGPRTDGEARWPPTSGWVHFLEVQRFLRPDRGPSRV